MMLLSRCSVVLRNRTATSAFHLLRQRWHSLYPTAATPVRDFSNSNDNGQERRGRRRIRQRCCTDGSLMTTPSFDCRARAFSSDDTGGNNMMSVDQSNESEWQRSSNPGLASVVAQGQSSLERSAALVAKLTASSGFEENQYHHPNNNSFNEQQQPFPTKKSVTTAHQLAEAQRIEEVAMDALEDLCSSNNNNNSNGLSLGGEPIVILHVEINRTIKLAKLYWCLPYPILLDPDVSRPVYQKLVATVQDRIVQQGGIQALSKVVHAALSFYYPPRLRLVPATDEMVRQAIDETL